VLEVGLVGFLYVLFGINMYIYTHTEAKVDINTFWASHGL